MNKESLTELSKILWQHLFARFPELQKYAKFVESETGDNNKSLYMQIPSPMDKKICLSILERGDCIEVSFSDGNPPGGAERQIICQK